MAYSKTKWVNNTTPINETNLNKIEQGIYDNSLVVDAITNTLNPTDTETYKTAELTEGQITDVIGVNDILIKGQTEQDGTPTPSAPVDVNVVSGSNVINIENENLLDYNAFVKGRINSTTGKIEYENNVSNMKIVRNTISFTTTVAWNSGISSDFILVKQNDYTYSIKNASVNVSVYVDCYDENKNYLSRYGEQTIRANEEKNWLISITNTNVKYIRLHYETSFVGTIILTNTMLKQSSTATTYEPHQGKELPLDLGNIELCKIGDYQDYFYKSGSKWYLHKEVGKNVLDGSEGWRLDGTLTNTLRMALDNTNMTPNALSNNFTYLAQYNTDSEHFYITNAKALMTFILKTTASDLANYKTWLASNNVTLYYALETATNAEITNTTLISQLDAIYNAPLYEQTNITQTNNDLPMVLDITACKDNINGIKAFIRK